jgi:hypothetical protein
VAGVLLVTALVLTASAAGMLLACFVLWLNRPRDPARKLRRRWSRLQPWLQDRENVRPVRIVRALLTRLRKEEPEALREAERKEYINPEEFRTEVERIKFDEEGKWHLN